MRRVGVIALVLLVGIVATVMGCGAFLGLDEPTIEEDGGAADGNAEASDGATPSTGDGANIVDASNGDGSLDGDASTVCVPQGGSCGAGTTCCPDVIPGLGEAYTCTRENICGLCTVITEPCDAAAGVNSCCELQAICSKDPNNLVSDETHCCWPFRTPCSNNEAFKCCSGKCKPDGGVDGGQGCALK